MPSPTTTDAGNMQREDIEFLVDRTCCRAWFYPPAHDGLINDAGAPCIVMAHGLAGTRDAGLEPYAERFAAAGLAVLLFDYRHFGASDGEPRQHVSVPTQLADWRAAVATARDKSGVDSARVALWGSSFSGGHVIEIAAGDSQLAAVSTQGAMMDGLGALKHLTKSTGAVHSLRLTALALKDRMGLRNQLPVVGEPGEMAILNTPGSKAGYLRITPDHWNINISTGFLATLPLYRPGLKAGQVSCPALFVLAEQDSIVPPEDMRAAAGRCRHAEVVALQEEHFAIYVGEAFERGCGAQTEFFTRVLAP